MLSPRIGLTIALCLLPAFAKFTVLPANPRLQGGERQSPAPEIASLKIKAEAGDPAAQLKLAHAYESGGGVPRDDELAANWYRKAAEQGNAEAQDALGGKYLLGMGVDKNKEQSVGWFRKSARAGNAAAMYHLGVAYYNGDGVPINDSLSYAWFRLAKEAGNPSAAAPVQKAEAELKPATIAAGLESIAEMYEKGESLPANQTEAARWWSLAAAAGDRDAQVALAFKLINAQGVTQDLPRAHRLCADAAKDNNVRAQYCLGYLSQRGLGVNQDAKKARTWYTLAAEKGETQAMKALALMETSGEGGKIDRVNAFLLDAKLARADDLEALHTLATFRKNLTPAEWQQLQKPLLQMRIDPTKLDKILQKILTP
jgi:TPR repeat protein